MPCFLTAISEAMWVIHTKTSKALRRALDSRAGSEAGSGSNTHQLVDVIAKDRMDPNDERGWGAENLQQLGRKNWDIGITVKRISETE